jgi:hypothetical protein
LTFSRATAAAVGRRRRRARRATGRPGSDDRDEVFDGLLDHRSVLPCAPLGSSNSPSSAETFSCTSTLSELDQFAGDARPDAASFACLVPPMLWPDVWEAHFAELIPTRAHWPARRYLSMLLVKLQTQCSWNAAARALGYEHLGAGGAVGYVNRASREGTVEALRVEVERVAQRVSERRGAR